MRGCKGRRRGGDCLGRLGGRVFRGRGLRRLLLRLRLLLLLLLMMMMTWWEWCLRIVLEVLFSKGCGLQVVG